jgi:hypothetical protein
VIASGEQPYERVTHLVDDVSEKGIANPDPPINLYA